MGHRTQITLTDEQYERLRMESDRTGLGLAELIRRAIDCAYGSTLHEEAVAGLASSFGSWTERDDHAAAYVDRLRRGMAQRLADA